MSDADLTSEELKQRNAEAVGKANSFSTHGVSPDEARKYLRSPEGIKYLTRLTEADPDLPANQLQERAIGHITAGRELPRMETIDEALVKIVPNGNTPSPHSPFWAKEADLDAAVVEGKNLSQHFALPVASEARQYDVYKITPKTPTEVFINTVAPTSELGGQVTKPGGATQYLTPNRNLYEPAEFVKTVDNRLYIQLQKTPAQHAPASPETHPVAHNTQPHIDGAKALGLHATLKGAGVAGALYGAYDGKQQVDTAIDTARSTREQWVRGAEETANVGTRSVVTGAAATAGAIPGAAVGALTSPVTGPVGPVGGALLTGGAAAYSADKAYEESRLQTFAKSVGRNVGELGYDYISREGRLLREVNGLQQDLQSETDPARRQVLQARLSGANDRFAAEVERNGRYFEAKGGIERSWEQSHAQYPKLDKDDVHKALAVHIDAGKRPDEAASAAYSDALHEQYPRARPHQPQENYRALSHEQLLEQHGSFTAKLVEDRREALTQAGNKDSHHSVDPGWTRALAQQRQAGRVEDALNAVWKDAGHVSAIRGAMQERGMKPPELPDALRERASSSLGHVLHVPEHGASAAPAPASARDAFRAQENQDRRSESVSSDFSRATAATHQYHFQVAEAALTPGLRGRGLDREEIERVSAATVSHAQQNVARGRIQGIYLSKDGQRVAVRQDTPPIGEFNVNTALTQTGEQHLERAQLLAQSQARSLAQEAPERGPTIGQTPAAHSEPAEAPPSRAMA